MEASEVPFIVEGTELICVEETDVFETPESWDAVEVVSAGSRLIAAGPPVMHEDSTMVMIKPHGAVDVLSIKLAECCYLVDNSELKSDSTALSYRNAPVLDDRVAGSGALYGSKVRGIVVLDSHNLEWLRVDEKLFLPLILEGSTVLRKVDAFERQCSHESRESNHGPAANGHATVVQSPLTRRGSDPSFPELRVASQKEMLDLFGETIRLQGSRVRKTKPCLARSAVFGERVITKVGSRCLSDLRVDQPGMVIKAPSASAEEYFLTIEKFEKTWQLPGRPLSCEILIAQGWKEYSPKPSERIIYELKDDDLRKLTTDRFQATFAVQALRVGDWLALIDEPGSTEVFLETADKVQSTYVAVGTDMVPQEEMLRLFEGRIRTHGQRMVKSKPCRARRAIMHEVVLTKLGARCIAEVTVNEPGMVVQAPTASGEEYFLTDSKFAQNWKLASRELGNTALADLGWKEYDPKPTVKIIYKPTHEDLQKIPAGRFQANFAVQTVTPGDYLALVGRGNSAEVYVMVEDKVRSQYVPVGTRLPRLGASMLMYSQWKWLAHVQPPELD